MYSLSIMQNFPKLTAILLYCGYLQIYCLIYIFVFNSQTSTASNVKFCLIIGDFFKRAFRQTLKDICFILSTTQRRSTFKINRVVLSRFQLYAWTKWMLLTIYEFSGVKWDTSIHFLLFTFTTSWITNIYWRSFLASNSSSAHNNSSL